MKKWSPGAFDELIANGDHNDQTIHVSAGQLNLEGAEFRVRVDESSVRTEVIADAVIRRAVANKAALIYQSAALLAFVDDLLGPEQVPAEYRRNAPTLAEALGISEDLADAEFLQVLKDLRDELRKFNDSLNAASAVSPDMAELSSRFASLRKVSLAAAIPLAAVVGPGAGMACVALIGNLLDQTGALPWDRFMQMFNAFKGVVHL